MKVYPITVYDYWRNEAHTEYRAEYYGHIEDRANPADAIVALCRYLRNNDLI